MRVPHPPLPGHFLPYREKKGCDRSIISRVRMTQLRHSERHTGEGRYDYRRGAAALGLSRTSTLLHLLLPAAVPGLVVGLVLGMGRALAETAALVFTSGYVDRMPESLLDSGRSLSIHIFDLSMNISGGDPNAYASALVLIVLLLAINGFASWVADRFLHRRIALV